jgi:hypothetical protein
MLFRNPIFIYPRRLQVKTGDGLCENPGERVICKHILKKIPVIIWIWRDRIVTNYQRILMKFHDPPVTYSQEGIAVRLISLPF